MKKDTEKTVVKFYKEGHKSVLAVFPNELYNERLYGKTMLTGYVHIGQHTSVHKDYLKGRRKATEQEYSDLKQELESIGYNLEIK